METPAFGYPQMEFTPINSDNPEWYQNVQVDFERPRNLEVKKLGLQFTGSDRIRMQSKWEGLSKAILTNSGSNKKLNIAVSMESHDNHELKFEYMKKFFTSGNKYS